jgi:hypothetical protein
LPSAEPAVTKSQPAVIAPPVVAPAETARREAERAAAARRGPTKVRVLTIPESIYRELQQRAGAAGVTITAYLHALLERDGAAVAAAPPSSIAVRPPSPAAARAPVGGVPANVEPSVTDLFARVRAIQAVEVTQETEQALVREPEAIEREPDQRDR